MANIYDDVSAQFVIGFPFTATMSIAGIRVNDMITERGWLNAERAFVEHGEACSGAELSMMLSNTDRNLRWMYERILMALLDVLENKLEYPHSMTSPEGIIMERKTAI